MSQRKPGGSGSFNFFPPEIPKNPGRYELIKNKTPESTSKPAITPAQPDETVAAAISNAMSGPEIVALLKKTEEDVKADSARRKVSALAGESDDIRFTSCLRDERFTKLTISADLTRMDSQQVREDLQIISLGLGLKARMPTFTDRKLVFVLEKTDKTSKVVLSHLSRLLKKYTNKDWE